MYTFRELNLNLYIQGHTVLADQRKSKGYILNKDGISLKKTAFPLKVLSIQLDSLFKWSTWGETMKGHKTG